MSNSIVENKMSEGGQWLKWGNYHRQVFGWKSDSDVTMIAMWIGIFRKWGFTPAEMLHATEQVLKRRSPIFKREDHISHLREAVFMQREATQLKPVHSDEELSRGTCLYCFNTGMCSVPWPKDIVNGEWVTNRTAGVWCLCYDGRKYSGSTTEAGVKLMGVHEYHQKYPSWVSQMKAKNDLHAQISTMQAAGREAGQGSLLPQLDSVLASMRARFGLIG